MYIYAYSTYTSKTGMSVNTNDRNMIYVCTYSSGFLQVILGGGRRYFIPNTTVDPEYNNINSNQRQDGRDLTQVHDFHKH